MIEVMKAAEQTRAEVEHKLPEVAKMTAKEYGATLPFPEVVDMAMGLLASQVTYYSEDIGNDTQVHYDMALNVAAVLITGGK